MATEANTSAPAEPPQAPHAPETQTAQTTTEKSQKETQPKDQKAKGEQPAKGGEPAGEKKLSGAELKKKAKEEKAARRAQAKAAQTSQGQPSGGQEGAGDGGKGGKGKPKQDGQAGGQHKGHHAKPAAAAPVVPKEVKPAVPECFGHLSMARRINITQADKDVDPAVLVLGQHMSTFALSDSITRLEATLYAFKKVMRHALQLRLIGNSKSNPPQRLLTHTQLPSEPPSHATSPHTFSTHKSTISQHAAPCASPWAMRSDG